MNKPSIQTYRGLEFGGSSNPEIQRQVPRFDALIIGGGPGGAGAAIALLDTAREQKKQISIGIIDPQGIGGKIGEYNIAGNSTACEVIDGLDSTSVAKALD